MSLTPSARKRRKERREQGNEREGDSCNLCFDTYDDQGNLKTPGFVEQSLRVNCGKCFSNKSKVAPQGVVPSKHSDSSDSLTGQPKNGGRRKTRRKRRKKRRKSRKMRKKTKRRRKRRRKKSKKVRRK